MANLHHYFENVHTAQAIYLMLFTWCARMFLKSESGYVAVLHVINGAS